MLSIIYRPDIACTLPRSEKTIDVSKKIIDDIIIIIILNAVERKNNLFDYFEEREAG